MEKYMMLNSDNPCKELEKKISLMVCKTFHIFLFESAFLFLDIVYEIILPLIISIQRMSSLFFLNITVKFCFLRRYFLKLAPND